jgi:hypothetical protein
LIYPRVHYIVFFTPTSRTNAPSVERTIFSTRMAQTRLSKDSDVSGGDQGKRNGEDTGLKRVMAVWKRNFSYDNCGCTFTLRPPNHSSQLVSFSRMLKQSASATDRGA